MEVIILIENLGLGGIERSAIRLAESISNTNNVTLYYLNKLDNYASSEVIPIKKFEQTTKVDWLIIHIDDGVFLKKINIPKSSRTTIIAHFPRISFLPHYNDIWTISLYNHNILKNIYKDIKLIYNPVSTLYNPVKKKDKKNKVIGRISRNDIVKIDFDTIVALIILSFKNYQLKLVGIPKSIKYLINFFGNSQQITYLNEISDEIDVKNFYHDIDILIHGSFAGETFGMVISEALSCGTPVIYSANFRKGLAPHELLHKSALCSGFWNIIKKTEFYLNQDSKYIFKLKKKDFCPDVNAFSLLSNKTNLNKFDYSKLYKLKNQVFFFRIYIFITNYTIILWYLFLKTFLGIEK